MRKRNVKKEEIAGICAGSKGILSSVKEGEFHISSL